MDLRPVAAGLAEAYEPAERPPAAPLELAPPEWLAQLA
jgi:hypothetical protein